MKKMIALLMSLLTLGLCGCGSNTAVTPATTEVTQHMSASPRRFGKVEVIFHMPAKGYSDKEKQALENAAHTCPVHLALHEATEQVFTFNWAE